MPRFPAIGLETSRDSARTEPGSERRPGTLVLRGVDSLDRGEARGAPGLECRGRLSAGSTDNRAPRDMATQKGINYSAVLSALA